MSTANTLPKMGGLGAAATAENPTTGSVSRHGFFSGQLMAANTPLGRLPTLGLNQIKLEDFVENGQDDNNMFRVHKKTEHLLVARELEREFKDLNKFEKVGLRIWDKPTSTRVDRPGTIRVVNEIPALKPIEFEKSRKRNARMNKTVDAGARTTRGNDKLVNIFDGEDSKMVRGETLRAIGHDERALVSAESSQQSDMTKSAYSSR